MNAPTQREEDLFESALQLKDASRRTAFLDFSCAGDLALRARIEGLLSAHEEAERFFEDGASLVEATRIADPPTRGTRGTFTGARRESYGEEPVGARIGRYKLIQKIGEGGCGIVYLAEQEEPVRRRVALKIIKVGMETRSVIARFEAERQALAMMDHPNIARVFDAGATERGSPYFVMEHVRGVRVTTYCDQNHLSTRQRLDLFVQICHAIQHAHQKGIVHGDIKPSNIMVSLHDGVPVPTVIDFGIAKATEARLAENVPLAPNAPLIGTPAYMSPEQVEMGGLDVDTRSDIYSLGVLLYELLTGRTPFDGSQLLESGVDGMRQMLREKMPVRPSVHLNALETQELVRTAGSRDCAVPRLVATVRGDLDWIAMKALEKDRRRRYETANALAMDVQRYMNLEPVLAHPAGWLYRLRKLVRRNRVVFIAGGAVALALVAGTGTSTWLLFKARDAEQQQARLRHEAETREKITQAALLVSHERFDEADAILNNVALVDPTVEGAAVFRSVGEWHAVQSRWKLAADRFEVLLRVNRLDLTDRWTLDYLERGPALIEAGDVSGYEKFRQEAIARFAAASNPFADRVVKISLLLPANERTLASLGSAVAATTKAFEDAEAAHEAFQAAWRAMSLALFEYRRGNYTNAANWCQRCLAYPDVNLPRAATAHVILALCWHQLGRAGDAGNELAAGREIIEAKFKGHVDSGTPVQGFWFDWVFARILEREGESLIENPTHGH